MLLHQQPSRWRIPGIGRLWPSFDRVVIISEAPTGLLCDLLRPAIAHACHSINIIDYNGDNPLALSEITIVGTRFTDPWSILAHYEPLLRRYWITTVEVAADIDVGTVRNAKRILRKLLSMISKCRHKRGCVWIEYNPDKEPPEGCAPTPTYYFEHGWSTFGLKLYIRRQKLPGGAFGRCNQYSVRIEWTIKRSRALKRHLGGNRAHDLLIFDLNSFIEGNLRLERVNYIALGNLLRRQPVKPRRSVVDPTLRRPYNTHYLAVHAAYRFLRLRALRRLEEANRHLRDQRFIYSEQQRLICLRSPADIRAYLRELRGRPRNQVLARKKTITNYGINACFKQIKLRRWRNRIIRR